MSTPRHRVKSTLEIHKSNVFWRTPPPDPTQLPAAAEVPYFRPGHQRVLMPDDFMPVGEHARKHLRAVPPAYLHWVNAQPWAQDWYLWQPVADYLTRFPLPSDLPPTPTIIFVSPLDPCTPTQAWPWPSIATLHTLPGYEDRLHAFALGALGLQRRWYQRYYGQLPHYELHEVGQARALGHGADLATRAQVSDHLRQWRSTGGVAAPLVRVEPDGTQRCTKHCYADLKDAQTAINERLKGSTQAAIHAKQYGAQPRRYRHNTPAFLRAYHCPLCGFHHITSKP